jgi:BlaI family transcriptional regulator, penicillinase repressor
MNRSKKQIRITDAEWDVLSIAWKKEPVAASEIVEAVAKQRNWSLATVRTLLTRLVKKGALRAEKEGRRFLYWPIVSMEACVRQESRSFIDRVFGGVPSSIILDLVKETELTKEDIQELRRILNDKEK